MTNHKTTGELFNEEYQSQKQEIIQKFKSESIEDHKWISDSNMGEANISILECDDNSITLSVGHPDECFNSSIYREDAIAIAKHFNLIPETENPHYDVVDGKISTKTPLSVESLESVTKVVK